MKTEAYVDGSYRDGKVGWGAVIVRNEEVYKELNGTLSEEKVEGTRQVAGELKAVLEVLSWCKKNKVDEITIYFDYMGIKCWVTGEWKAKKNITQKYRDYVKKAGIKIEWVKVKSHSGDKFNDMADELAGSAIS
jgi:ribonuclease HI